MMKKYASVPVTEVARHVNNMYRIYGAKRSTPADKLAVLRTTISAIGKLVCLYGIDPSIRTDFLADVLPAYRGIEDEVAVAAVYDEVFTIVRRVRNRLNPRS